MKRLVPGLSSLGDVAGDGAGANEETLFAYDQVMAVIVVIGIIGYALDTLSRVVLDRRA